MDSEDKGQQASDSNRGLLESSESLGYRGGWSQLMKGLEYLRESELFLQRDQRYCPGRNTAQREPGWRRM